MKTQNLFETIIKVTGFTPLESDMREIIKAYEKDRAEQTNNSVNLPISGSADIIKFGTYLTGHDEETIKQMLNDYQRHSRNISGFTAEI